jgi:signal transduction histidine kinase
VAGERLNLPLRILLLAVAYLILAKAGLVVATVGKTVTLVWPPTGLSLAILLLGSRREWPGVALGAFVANVTTPGVGVGTAAAIAAGNTLEAYAGAALIRRRDFQTSLDRTRDVLRLVLWGALVAPTVSASIGTLAIGLAGIVPLGAALLPAFRIWWMGDAMSALVVAPTILAWTTALEHREPRSRLEPAALVLALSAASLFAVSHGAATTQYLVFPPVIWAALRFGPRGATAATLLVTVVTVWSTVTGHGAFAASTLADNLMSLHAFMASVVLTGLVLGATSAERARAIRAREHFISIASHELRSPLAPIRLQVQRLLRNMAPHKEPMPRERVVEALEVIDRQVGRLTRLLEDVLDVTRLRLGRLQLSPKEMDLGALIDEIAESQREPLAQSGCTLTIERRGPLAGRWDRERLSQVVTNLLSNAVKHGGPGVVELTLEGRPPSVRLTVRDHGPGVPEGDRERIFARFERGFPEAAASTRGVGLGLYIAREIVTAHGGRISVSAAPGGGAAFEITLPTAVPGG